jgi:hypothetical protein
MTDEPIPLFKVLIEEYNSQQERGYSFPHDAFNRYRELPEDDDDGRKRINSEELKKFYLWLHTDERAVKRAALCFSGGGIRSATFGLGVVQGLARRGLLSKFDFISTVSGGGYLGSWLSAWIHRKGVAKVEQRLKNELPSSPLSPEPDPIVHLRSYSNYMSPKVGLLSADTWTLVAIFLRNLILNWLVLVPLILLVLMIPRFCVGAIRADSQAFILPFLKPAGMDGAFWLAVVLGIVSIAYVYVSRPSLADANLRGASKPGSVFWNKAKTQGWFLVLCLVPLGVATVAITSYYAWLGNDLAALTFPRWGGHPAVAFMVFGVMLQVGGLLLALIWLRKWRQLHRELLAALVVGGIGGLLTWLVAGHLFPNPSFDIASTVVYVCFASPAFLGLFLLAATVWVGASSRLTEDADREWVARAGAWMLIAGLVWMLASVIVIFGPVLLLYAAKTAVSVGTLSGLVTLVLGHSGKSSAKCEQSTTATDMVLMVAAPLFAVFILTCLSLGTAWLLVALPNSGLEVSELTSYEGLLHILEATPFTHLILISAVFTLVAILASGSVNINKFSLHGAYRDRLIRAYLGASRVEKERKPNPFTGFDENDNLQMQHLRTQLFHEDNVNFVKLVSALQQAQRSPKPKPGQESVSAYVLTRLSNQSKSLLAKASGVSNQLMYSLLDDLNRILHGPSIFTETLFTGIDLGSSVKELTAQTPLVETLRLNRLLFEAAYPQTFQPTPKCRPLHVINMTLNLVGGKNLAWQNRQAESFTVSALHSGSYCVGYRDSRIYGRNKQTNSSITLGTAAAISGAAVSPNMGYYSSTFVTFLLALFNLRLGWWLGNPGKAGNGKWGFSTYDTAGPKLAARPLIAETLGLTSDSHPYVYLSDGGHFENLGLYEMVLRRCRMIIVSDGSADPDFGLEGLGNAISKIRVDLGVPLEIDNIFMLGRDQDQEQRPFGDKNPKFTDKYCAIGRVCYSCMDRTNPDDDRKKYDGVFIYIKPFLSGTEPVDVYNYAKTHKSFPHEPTADQMYDEAQFESYRALGSHIMDKIFDQMPRVSGIEDIFEWVEQKVGKVPECSRLDGSDHRGAVPGT